MCSKITSRRTLPSLLNQDILENKWIVMNVIAASTNEKGKKKSDENSQKLLELFKGNILTTIYWNIFYFVGIIGIGVLWSIPVSLIPMTNTILYPAYWWEVIVYGPFFTHAIYKAGFTTIECHLIFDFKESKSMRRFLFLCTINYTSMVTIWCSTYLIATIWLEIGYPLPLVGIIIYVVGNASHMIATWFSFPYKMRQNKLEWKKIWVYTLYNLWWIVYVQENMILSMLMNALTLEYKCNNRNEHLLLFLAHPSYYFLGISSNRILFTCS